MRGPVRLVIDSGSALQPLTPEKLIASRHEAVLCLIGFSLFFGGFPVAIIGGLLRLTVVVLAAVLMVTAGVLLRLVLISRVSHRLAPGVGMVTRWWFETRLGTAFERRSVLRRAARLARQDRDVPS